MSDMKEAGVVKAQLADREHSALDGSLFQSSSYETILTKVGYADKNEPATISIYASTFENKDYIEDLIKEYNSSVDDKGQIRYTDYMGIMLSSVTDIINAVSYVLIGFVSVSLIVSSIKSRKSASCALWARPNATYRACSTPKRSSSVSPPALWVFA